MLLEAVPRLTNDLFSLQLFEADIHGHLFKLGGEPKFLPSNINILTPL